jgi:hypothetical protein
LWWKKRQSCRSVVRKMRFLPKCFWNVKNTPV